MDSFSSATVTNTCYCHVHCFCSLCDGIKPCYFIIVVVILDNTFVWTFMPFCDFIPIFFRVRFETKQGPVCISSFALVDGMNDGKSKLQLCLMAAIELLNEISIKIILIYRLALPFVLFSSQ